MKNILMGFSGGPSSRAMLRLLHQYTSSHNKYGDLRVVYIDETAVTQNKTSYTDEIREIVKEYPFEFITLNIEDAYKLDSDTEPLDSRDRLLKALSDLKTLSAQEDLIENLRHSLLVQAARDTKSAILLLGDSSTRIAIKTIGLTSKGRGFSLPFEVAAEAAYYKGISIIRPMRDSLSKEIGIYNHFVGLQHPSIPNILTRKPPKSSIYRLAEEFIVGLDTEFPSTVSTVVRTANKLSPSQNIRAEIWCPLCLNPAEVDVTEWKESIAVRRLAPSAAAHISDSIGELLCYGCRTNWDGAKSPIPLPANSLKFTDDLQTKRANLKSQIQDFLIED